MFFFLFIFNDSLPTKAFVYQLPYSLQNYQYFMLLICETNSVTYFFLPILINFVKEVGSLHLAEGFRLLLILERRRSHGKKLVWNHSNNSFLSIILNLPTQQAGPHPCCSRRSCGNFGKAISGTYMSVKLPMKLFQVCGYYIFRDFNEFQRYLDHIQKCQCFLIIF